MDVLSHLLWTIGLFHRWPWKWKAALLGFLADAVVFGPIMAVHLWQGQSFGPHRMEGPFVEAWAQLYYVTHSLVVVAFIAIAIFAVTKRFWYPLLGWALAVLIDIPTHSQEFFPTPFLWPISSWTVDGIPWSDPRLFIANWLLLAALFAYLHRELLAAAARKLVRG